MRTGPIRLWKECLGKKKGADVKRGFKYSLEKRKSWVFEFLKKDKKERERQIEDCVPIRQRSVGARPKKIDSDQKILKRVKVHSFSDRKSQRRERTCHNLSNAQAESVHQYGSIGD